MAATSFRRSCSLPGTERRECVHQALSHASA
nr:MAG TPA: hypothetical protein [Caudoviricetes sp.]